MRVRPKRRRKLSALIPISIATLFALFYVGSALAQTYVVRQGDTLYDIGLQYGVEPAEIANANGIDDVTGLQVGQKISIPESSGSALPAGEIYVVVIGDTLSGIAQQLGVSESDLARANNISDVSYLYAGQKLTVPGGSGSSGSQSATTTVSSGSYVVASGDTLSGIADQFGLTANTVAAANGITDADSLRVGQELVIPERQQLSGRGGGRLAFVWPAFGEITGYFHERGPYWVKGYHEGLDIGSDWGNVIRAAEAGVVVEAEYGWNKGYGNYVKIDHGNGLITLYGHQSELAVDAWDEVKRGQVIGYIGSTGASTGPHLHFEVRVDGEKTDPLKYLP